MLPLFVSTNAASFIAGGLVCGTICAVAFYNLGWQRRGAAEIRARARRRGGPYTRIVVAAHADPLRPKP